MGVKLVLVRFEIAQLGELFVALVEAAGEGFWSGRRVVDDAVGADIATLGEGFVTDIAAEGPFATVAAFVGLEDL